MSDPPVAGILPPDDGTIAGLIDARQVRTLAVNEGMETGVTGPTTPATVVRCVAPASDRFS